MSNSYKILVVDDETSIITALKRVFADDDMEIIGLSNPKEALDYIKTKKMDMIISDQNMLEMTGIELLRYAKDISPDTIRILITGMSDISVAVSAINEGSVYYYITKPWDSERLVSIVKEALEEKDRDYLANLPSISKIPVWDDGAILLIDIDNIYYMTHSSGAVSIVLYDQQYRSTESLQYWENKLRPHSFYKCHRSYLVNLNKIEQIIPWSNGIYDIKLVNKDIAENIPVSKNYARGLKEILDL